MMLPQQFKLGQSLNFYTLQRQIRSDILSTSKLNTKLNTIPMQSIRSKFSTLKSPAHYLSYCATFIGFGCLMSGLGPLIPYLSHLTGHDESEYAIIFLSRSFGFIAGAILLKTMQKHLSFHSILAVSSLSILGFLALFSVFLNIMVHVIIMFFVSCISCFFCILINVCILKTQQNGNIQLWMLMAHGFFGVGGLIGPYFVFLFQEYSFLAIGILMGLVSPAYFILKSPEDHNEVQKQVQGQGIIDQIGKTGPLGELHSLVNETKQKQLLPINIQRVICFMYLLYVGLQCTFASWISTFSVLQGVSTKQQATQYSSLFWTSITVARFISSCITIGTVKKVQILLYSLTISAFLSLILILNDMTFAGCIFSSISFGMCLSSIYPLLFSIPNEYGFQVTPKLSSKFVLWASLGEGVLSTIVGYAMAWFTNDMLFYSMLLMAFSFLFAIQKLIQMFKVILSANQQGYELENKLMTKILSD